MHLHRLTLQAIGPFPGRHTVDFAALGASGLFLLEGPTGSGKSTLIDAVVFALYGKVAAREASEERLRSGHATPADESVVDLVFEAGSGIYRVRRTPAYARPKKSGSGTTMQQATAKLWRLTSPDAPDDGDPMATRLDEVGGELQRIIGLDRDQFVQTVVLPQGEFASFLRARPEDRRGLLQRVFGTETYDRVEQRLAAMRTEANRTVADARDDVGLAVAHFLGAGGLDEEAADAVREALAEPGDALVVAVSDAAAQVAADAGRAEVAAGAARQACQATRAELTEARRVLAAVRRRDALLAEQDALLAGAPVRAEGAGRLDLARRAQRVWPCVLGADQAERALADADAVVRAAASSARAGLADLVVDDATEPGVRLKTLAVERDACTVARARLARPLELEDALPQRRRQFERVTAEAAARALERATLATELAERPQARVALVAERARVAADAARQGEADAAVGAAERAHGAAVQATALDEQATRLAVAAEAARAAAESAATTVAELHLARIAGMAAELALDLRPGAPCPVCGGTEHPHPARPGPRQVTADAVAAAEAERAAAQQAFDAALAELADVRAKRDAAAESAGGSLADAAARLTAARAAAQAAAAAVAERDRLDAALAELDVTTTRLTAQLTDLDVAIAAAQAEVAAAGDRLTADEAEVLAARGDAASVLARSAALDERIALVTTWMTALADLERATDRWAERSAELAAAVAEHGFDDVVAVRAAAVPEADIRALERLIAEHDAATARVTAGLAEPEVAELPSTLDAAAAADRAEQAGRAASEADAAATTADGDAARLRDRAASSATAAERVVGAVGALSEAQRLAGPVIRMANLAAGAGGDNAKQLSLGTYVLVRRFEDVVAAANSRLVVMSGGRYELARSEERERGGARKLGLAMKVVDHETDAERDPRTLSGGETFYVSLCLALGLADVVTAEAGGIDLGTLFIDEGFGALDPETLDTVLGELGRLREGGRVVGVVSHVEAMKQAIAERVEVRRTRDGSSTLTVRA